MVDKLDLKILDALEDDPVITIKALANSLRISREKAQYRISKLESQEIIVKYGAEINKQFFEYGDFCVLLKTSSRTEEFSTELQNTPYVKWMNETIGDYSYYGIIIIKSMTQLLSYIKELDNNINIKEYILLPVKDYIGSKPLGLSHTKKPRMKIHRKNHLFNLTANDFKLLTELANNARTTNIQLAKKTNLTQKTIAEKKRKFKNTNLWSSNFCSIDVTKLGYTNYKVFYKLHKSSKEFLSEIVNHHKQIIYADILVGEWSNRFDITVRSEAEFQEVLLSIENQLGDKLRSFTVLRTVKELKRTSFPPVMHEK